MTAEQSESKKARAGAYNAVRFHELTGGELEDQLAFGSGSASTAISGGDVVIGCNAGGIGIIRTMALVHRMPRSRAKPSSTRTSA